MPIYEYRCEQGHSFEAFQSMSDDPLTECEVCEAPAARQLSAPAVHFKGSGFYTTDYARKGKSKGAEGGSSSSSGSSDSSSSSSSSKSDSGSGSGGDKPKAASSGSKSSD